MTAGLAGGAASVLAADGVAGTYEGVGEGRNGDIVVEVTLDDDGVITDIEVTEQEETDGVGTLAFDLIPSMVENNTIAVDAVTGATLSSEGLIEAVTNALLAAGVDPADYENAVSAEQGEDTTYDVDVVIIGAGGAGMAAAASAAEQGASVLVLEKSSAIGGNTKLGEGTYNSADPDMQASIEMTADNCAEVEEAISVETDDPEYQALIDDVAADYAEWQENNGETLFDSVNWHALQTYIGGGSIDNIELIRLYAEQAPVTLEWLEDEIGIPFKSDYIFMAIGGKWARGHQVDLVAATGAEGDNGGRVYIEKLEEYATERGTIIETNAPATSLLIDENGTVVGCEATRTDGSVITVNADSVILTTGGYGADSDLVLKYSDGAITTTLHSCAVTSTGDGLALAEEAGASLINLDQIQVHPLGDPIDDCGCVSEFVGNWLSATEYLFVNKEGERFINEDNTRYAISMAELEQTDGEMWLIVDSSEIADDDTRDELIASLLADGHSYVADTLEELAEIIGVDADTLLATVETYNEGMVNGEDEYGKSASADSVIEQGPFYASLRTPTVHYTMGGIEINTEAQVIDTEGNVIEGLYAAGEVTSGIHGNNRLGGNAYPDIMTFGRIAGLNAAAAAAEE
ncbi:MAG: FAD-dependent oxidoreductase [Lachnospiraceae bacterium]|nr:FAD-dependent oxidoreductase [Lachnospiraceae bacterium]